MPRSDRDDRVVILEVVRKVSEKVDEADNKRPQRRVSIRFAGWAKETFDSQLAHALKVGGTPFFPQRLGIVKEPDVPPFERHLLLPNPSENQTPNRSIEVAFSFSLKPKSLLTLVIGRRGAIRCRFGSTGGFLTCTR